MERENNIQKEIMLTTQIIDAEKKSQMDLIFRSNNDLFNKRRYKNGK